MAGLALAGTRVAVDFGAREYLAGDPRYPSYAALVSVFTGAMCTVVVADDLWVLLVGWELMGACSYFLISHHWELREARAGAVKAFLMTRTADLGLLFAIIVLGKFVVQNRGWNRWNSSVLVRSAGVAKK